jgi:hypothetical protein
MEELPEYVLLEKVLGDDLFELRGPKLAETREMAPRKIITESPRVH